MSDVNSLPEGLRSTASFLARAYPNELPEDEYLPLVFLLYEHMSHRNLATVLANMFGRDYDAVLNDIGKAAALAQSAPDSIARVRNTLISAGYEKWAGEV